jgi:hypothetical protein
MLSAKGLQDLIYSPNALEYIILEIYFMCNDEFTKLVTCESLDIK